MTVDMGGIAWPVKGGAAVTAPAIGSVKVDRPVAYKNTAAPVTLTATGTDGKPYTGPLEVVLTDRTTKATVRVPVVDGTFSLANVPLGRYELTVPGWGERLRFGVV